MLWSILTLKKIICAYEVNEHLFYFISVQFIDVLQMYYPLKAISLKFKFLQIAFNFNGV